MNFKLIISSPEGTLFSGECERISLRGSEGSLSVMAGHTPFITSVKPCEPVIYFENGEKRKGICRGGLLTVDSDAVTLISGTFKFED